MQPQTPTTASAGAMWAAVREYQGPTGVTFALRGRFGPPGSPAWGIVFIKRSSLELYNVRANATQARLDLLAVAPLPATVVSAAAQRRGAAPADFLWLGFSALRVAALAWDPTVREWATLQTLDLATIINAHATAAQAGTARDSRPMSSVPGDEHRVLVRGRYSDHANAKLRVDGKGRCVAVLAEELGLLIVLPVRSDDDLSAAAASPASVTDRTPLVNEVDIYIIDLIEDYGIANVKDFVFLDDYFEPTVLLLHEPERTWAGRITSQRNTAQLTAVTLDLRHKTHSKTWEMAKLPSDAHKVVGIPETAGGGVLVFSTNVLMQVRHEACVAGLSLNSFGDSYASELKSTYPAIVHSETLMSLDAARCSFLDSTDSPNGLLSLKGGELYFLTVAETGRSSLSLIRAGSTVLASAIVPVNDRFFVLASRISDSLLVEYRRTVVPKSARAVVATSDAFASDAKPEYDANDDDDAVADAEGKSGGKRSRKRQRTAEEETEYEMLYGTAPPAESESDTEDLGGQVSIPLELVDKDEGTRGVYDDDDELGLVFSSGGNEERVAVRSGSESWSLKVRDTLTCYGPAADVAIGRSPDDTDGALDCVIAGGYAKNGCLGVMQHTIRPRGITRFALEGFTRTWTLRDPSISRRETAAREGRNVSAAIKNSDIRARNVKRQTARERFITERIDEWKVAETARAVSTEAEKSAAELMAGEAESDADLPDDKDGHMSGADGEPPIKRSKTGTTANGGSEEFRIPRRQAGSDSVPTPADDIEDAPADAANTESVGDVEAASAASAAAVREDSLAAIQAEANEKFPIESEVPLEEIVTDVAALHSYMLISNEFSTVAMSTGEDLEQIQAGGVDFVTDSCTIAAGNVLGYAAVVQVHPHGVRLLKEGRIQAEHNLSDGCALIVGAQVSDPLVMLLLGNGSVVMLRVHAEEFQPEKFVNQATGLSSPDAANHVGAIGDDEMDGLFDDYGVADKSDATVHGILKEGTIAHDASAHAANDLKFFSARKAGPDAGAAAGSVLSDYCNIRLVVELSLEAKQSGNRVASACIYKGSLSTDAVRKVVGSDGLAAIAGTGSGVAGSANGHQAVAEGGVAVSTLRAESGQDDAIDDMDEEERMLYGDAGEEERMLYGDANPDADEDKSGGPEGMVVRTDAPGSSAGSNALLGDVIIGDVAGSGAHLQETTAPEAGVFPLISGTSGGSLLVTVTKDGALEMRSAGLGYRVVLRCAHFFIAPQIVVDDGCVPDQSEQKSVAADLDGGKPGVKALKAKKKDRITSLVMTQITGTTLVPGLCTPILVAMQASGFPLIYRAFIAPDVPTNGLAQSSMRLNRVSCDSVTTGMLAASSSSPASTGETSCLVPFENVAGRGGVFVGGRYPFFVFAERGYPRAHPLRYKLPACVADNALVGSGVTGFAELHNVNCPRGFIDVADGGVVGVSELASPAAVNFDSPTPFRKVTLRCTPHKVAYHAGSSTYGVLASMPTLTKREERLARMLQSLEKHDKRHYQSTVAQVEAETGDDRVSRVPPLFEEVHELRVYRPDGWQLIKSYKMKKGEVGLAIANITVDVYKQRPAGSGVHIPSTNRADDGGESLFAASQKLRPKNMLVVGTGFLNGEDATTRGRLLMFEISRQKVYAAGAGDYTAFQLQLIAETELPGPVTAVAPMEGYVVAGVGPQLGVYKLVQDEIVYLAFAFGQLFCTSIASIKQYVASADMFKSVSFHFFRERNQSVNFLAKDYAHGQTYSTEFLIDGEQVSLVSTDADGNVQLFNYANAMVPESRGGKRLLLNGGINLGSRVNKMHRVKLAGSSSGTSGAGRHATVFATLDGGLGAVVPISSTQFAQLEALSKVMLAAPDVVRHAGLDPADARAFRPASASTQLLQQRLIDTRLPLEVLKLGPARMRTAGTAAGLALSELAELARHLDAVRDRF
jgi:CPSF A subunit region/Mono-functional DNA-alkylating methyl methanesulfonate N-term